MKRFLPILFLLWAINAQAATFYVRSDGGPYTRCLGTTDAADTGSGENQPCAVNSIYQIFPPDSTTPNLSFAGGDTVVFKNGTYVLGAATPNSGQLASNCYEGNEVGCSIGAIPSGPDAAHPTRIIGEEADTGCSTKPVLWGANRLEWLITLGANKSNFDIECLELTDHDDCIESSGHTDNSCPGSAPYVDLVNARTGIYAQKATNVTLKNLYIHGLGDTAIHATGTNWSVTDVIMQGNKVGWDGDTGTYPDTSGDSGYMNYTDVTIKYSGCAEDYPISGSPVFRNCTTGNSYADGFGTDTTDAVYTFIRPNFSFNTHDGLDLLYGSATSEVYISQGLFENNAGQQVKIKAGTGYVENSIIIGNCCYLHDTAPLSNTCTDNCPGESTTICRASGDVVNIVFNPGSDYHFFNNTIESEGNILLLSEDTGACDGTEVLEWKNNVAVGSKQCVAEQNTDLTDFFWVEASSPNCAEGTLTFTVGNSIVYNTKDDEGALCPTGATCTDPALSGVTWTDGTISIAHEATPYESGDFYLTSSSTNSIDLADETVSGISDLSIDYNSFSRGASWDIGALEYGSTPTEESTTTTLTISGVTITGATIR